MKRKRIEDERHVCEAPWFPVVVDRRRRSDYRLVPSIHLGSRRRVLLGPWATNNCTLLPAGALVPDPSLHFARDSGNSKEDRTDAPAGTRHRHARHNSSASVKGSSTTRNQPTSGERSRFDF